MGFTYILPDLTAKAGLEDLACLLELQKDPKKMLESLPHLISKAKPRFPPPSRLPCANIHPSQYKICDNPGLMACSACRLVSYCSLPCQRSHWKVHKKVCKDPLRATDWKAGWARERRPPGFLVDQDTSFEVKFDTGGDTEQNFSVGLALWGNTPAVDLLNLPSNEKDPYKDYSIALAASGDLRDTVKTINGLPEEYSGHLTLVLNDGSLPLVARNLILLIILATIPDPIIAADVALYFWYSVFLPPEYRQQLSGIMVSFLQHVSTSGNKPFPLGKDSNLVLPKFSHQIGPLKKLFESYLGPEFTLEDAQAEYDRVREAPSRQDYRDRMYSSLKPSHRVAFQHFRRFGILLPLGAINAHFSMPNASLFSQDRRWWQTDYADPLEGYDVTEVIDIGKRYGATPEDIYGCLYFFLTEQLTKFATRIRRKFKISLKLFSLDASDLADTIREDFWSNVGLPATVRFDRIAVSNILDANYVGLEKVLTKWGPLLSNIKSAAIVGYFMNWFVMQKDGKACSAGPKVIKEACQRQAEIPYFKKKMQFGQPSEFNSPDVDLTAVMSTFTSMCNALEVVYDNSKPFVHYLIRQGLPRILKETNLRLRQEHTIYPHRIGVRISDSPSALPSFPDEESWYHHLNLTSNTWIERFVEFTHK